jgi:hypothetical protein
MTRHCPCGNAITRPHGKLCEACRQERQSNGGRPKGKKYVYPEKERRLANERRTTSQQATIMKEAICLKCPEGHNTHMVAVRRDNGLKLYEYCKDHSGLRNFSGHLYELPSGIHNGGRHGAAL